MTTHATTHITKRQWQCLGAALLVIGWSIAAGIYVLAPERSANIAGYEFVDGQAYALTFNDQKRYQHDLERFGGKSAVLADDFNRWLADQWQGKRLGRTLGIFASLAAFFCFRRARQHQDSF